jgi:hypothetical protein
MESQVSNDVKDYLSHFYNPKLTAYEFLKCFFAFLKKEKLEIADRDISDFLYEQKNDKQNYDVLKEIKFRSNGVFLYSNDIENALFNLQNGGLLGKMNPSFGIILIKYTDEEVNKIIADTPKDCIPAIENIAKVYAANFKH